MLDASIFLQDLNRGLIYSVAPWLSGAVIFFEEVKDGLRVPSCLRDAMMGGRYGVKLIPAPWSVSEDGVERSRTVTLWPWRRRTMPAKRPARDPPTYTVGQLDYCM